VVGASGGAGDVGLAVCAVVSDRGVTEGGHDGGAAAGAGMVKVFAEGDVADVVDLVLDQPFVAGPVLQVDGLGVLGGQGDGVEGGFPGGLGADGAGTGDPDGLLGVGGRQAAGGGHGEGLDGAGLPASVTGCVAGVADRDVGPGQRLELCEQG